MQEHIALPRCQSPSAVFPVLKAPCQGCFEPVLAPKRPCLIARPRFIEGPGSFPDLALLSSDMITPESGLGVIFDTKSKRKCEELDEETLELKISKAFRAVKPVRFSKLI